MYLMHFIFKAPDVDSGGGGDNKSEPEDELEIEKQWLLRARADKKHFLYFYEKYYDHIYRFIYWKTLDHDLTQDLTAEIFLQALDKFGQFKWKRVTVGAWLYKIALNKIRAHFKGKLKRKYTSTNRLKNMQLFDPDPLETLILEEDQLLMQGFLQKFDELSRNIFILHYWEDLKVHEVAAALGKREGTIKSRLKRDREKIAKMLSQQGFAERWRKPRKADEEAVGD